MIYSRKRNKMGESGRFYNVSDIKGRNKLIAHGRTALKDLTHTHRHNRIIINGTLKAFQKFFAVKPRGTVPTAVLTHRTTLL